MKVVLCAINSSYIHSNPALFSLKRAVESMEQPPHFVTRQYSVNFPYDMMLSELYEERPDIAAFSAYIWNIAFLERLLSDLGTLLPQTMLLLGGPEATARPKELLKRCPNLAGVVLGEGELLWPNLLKQLQQGKKKPPLPGMLWRGHKCSSTEAPFPDFALLPFPYSAQDLADIKSGRHIIYYESSRGCPYKCSFCASAHSKLRERPLDKVLRELPKLAQTDGQIKFVDRTFNINPPRALAITQAVLDLYQPGLSWHFEISPYNLPQELLDLWAKAPPGYIRLEAGVQSLHKPSLAAIRRQGDWLQAKQTLKNLLEKDNVQIHLDLIAGLPEETPATFAAAFAELHALAPHYLQLGFLKILPGTPLSFEAAERGLLYSAYPPYQILKTPTMEGGELLALGKIAKALNAFYNSGCFSQTLQKAAKLWPDGALNLYGALAKAMQEYGPGGLSLIAKAEVLAKLLLPINYELYLNLLRFDWQSRQNNQPLPLVLR